MTVRHAGLDAGDVAGAVAQAEYLLAESDSPGAFRVDPGDHAGGCLSDGSAHAVWFGSGLALTLQEVSLGAPATVESLALALQGLSSSGKQVRKAGRGRVNTPEVHFAVPKSVSILWSLLQDDLGLRAAVERSLLWAATESVRDLMEMKDVCYRGKDETESNVYGPANGFVAVGALHVTSRVADGEIVPAPQLHVHVRLVGVDRGDETLLTPDTEDLFKRDTPLEGDAMFLSRVAQKMVQLGFGVRAGTGRKRRYFEIDGVSDEAIDDASGRRRQVAARRLEIERNLERSLSGREAAELALKGRRGKVRRLSPEVMAAGWRGVAAQHGLTFERVRGWRRRRALQALPVRLERARREALERFRECGPTVSLAEANAIVQQAGFGTLSVRQATLLLDKMDRAGDLLSLEGGRVTTRAIREQEELVIGTVLRAAERGGVEVSPAAMELGLERAAARRGFTLDPEQANAARLLCAGHGVSVLHGRAGTGKSPVLLAVAEARRADGWQVLSAGPDGQTEELLSDQVGGPTYTLASLIKRVERGEVRLTPDTHLIVDECSKVSGDDWATLVPWVEQYGIELTLSGHVGQHDAILLPGMFAEIERQRHPDTAFTDVLVPGTELTEIRRHRMKWHKELQVEVDHGRGGAAIKLLRDHDAITVNQTPAQAVEHTVRRWDHARTRHEDPKAVIMVVSGSNDDVDLINELAQARRRSNQELGGASVPAIDRNYRIHVGDLVVVACAPYELPSSKLDRRREPRVENRTIGIVQGIDPDLDLVHVALSEPGRPERIVTFDQRELRDRRQRARSGERVPALRLGYAHHTFPIQGATVADVFFCLVSMPRKNGFYVGLTRQRERLHVDVHQGYGGRVARDDDEVFEALARNIGRTDTPMLSIRFKSVTSRIAQGAPRRGRSLIEEPHVPVVREPSRPGRAVQPAPILARLAEAFGPERAKSISERARALASRMATLSDDALARSVSGGVRAVEGLDVGSARRFRRLDRRRDMLTVQIRSAQNEAEKFETEAERTGGPGRRAMRRRKELDQAAETHETIASHRWEELEELIRERDQLRKNSGDPNVWLVRHEDQVVYAIAADRELRIRGAPERLPDAPHREQNVDLAASVESGVVV